MAKQYAAPEAYEANAALQENYQRCLELVKEAQP